LIRAMLPKFGVTRPEARKMSCGRLVDAVSKSAGPGQEILTEIMKQSVRTTKVGKRVEGWTRESKNGTGGV